jgi:hypothetical protein
LLLVVAQDGNNHIFPVAFAIVEGETKEAWNFFLKNLRMHVTPQLLNRITYAFQWSNQVQNGTLFEVVNSSPKRINWMWSTFAKCTRRSSHTSMAFSKKN